MVSSGGQPLCQSGGWDLIDMSVPRGLACLKPLSLVEIFPWVPKRLRNHFAGMTGFRVNPLDLI